MNTRIAMRAIALAGSLTLLAGSSAFAQGRYDRNQNQNQNQAYANRTVDGTVASVSQDRNGNERVRLTNGMDVLVPNTIMATHQGRRYGAATLQPGDVVRLSVYSRQGDGRDAEVRSMEIVSRNSIYNNDRRLNGTVVSVNRRNHTLLMRADNGQTMTINFAGYNDRNNTSATNFRKGDRISITGRNDRGNVIADDIRINNNRR